MGATGSVLPARGGWHRYRTDGAIPDRFLAPLSLSGPAAMGCAHPARGPGQPLRGAVGLFKRVQGWGGEPGPLESRRVSSWQSCPSHVEQPQLTVPLGCGDGGAGSIKPCGQRSCRQHQEPGLGKEERLHPAQGCALWADMELDVQRAKDLIEQKLAEEEEEEKVGPQGRGRVSTPDLEEEKRHGPRNWGLEAVKGQERVRKSSVDLRREIIDVGSIQRLIELRKQRRQRREERAATPEPPPPPEPLEIEGPVEPETFLRAAVQGKMRVIEKFLADGGSPDTCDEFHRTALHRSSLEGHTDILQKLLDSGATVNFRDRLDCTAVHWACRGGHLDAVKLLQDHGADLNMKDKLLSTPLHVATRTGHLDIVEHLIHCGVDINSPDREGDTALHDATRLSRYKIIKMLILYGADMMAKNHAGKTPTDLVQQWQVDTRQALEAKEQPQGEMEVPA
ncbi:ankyrin repeat domain-containing protein 2 isoform X4 [Athene noctua]|uniref:ankyrin repeat domain-containing protein 2 isoform X4 n=1 Tax=Athene noctua TaxID=126797 RepID=UPI003EBF8E05